jgi:hypothetical protein
VFDPVVGSVAAAGAFVVVGATELPCGPMDAVVGVEVAGATVVAPSTRRLVVVSAGPEVVVGAVVVGAIVVGAIVVGAGAEVVVTSVVVVGGFVQVVVGVFQRGD